MAAERFYRAKEGLSLRDAGLAAGAVETVVRAEEIGAVVLRGEPGLWGRLTVVEKIGRSGKGFGGGLAAANECWGGSLTAVVIGRVPGFGTSAVGQCC